ncbi:MAG: ATP-binding protein [Thermodesulfobacteriota bacterium]
MPRHRYIFAAFFILLVFVGVMWIAIWRFHEDRAQETLSLWTDLQRELVDQTARSMKQWLALRVAQGVDEETARREAIDKFIKPILLLPGSGAWVADRDYLIYHKGGVFNRVQLGSRLPNLLQWQESLGGENCRRLCTEIQAMRRGSDWYVPAPESGPVHAAWTRVSAGDASFVFGLSTPASSVLSEAGVSQHFTRELQGGTIITAFALLLSLFLWRQKRQGEKLITVMEENASLMGQANRKLEEELKERSLAEGFLKESEVQKKAIIDGIPSGLLHLDHSLRIRLANRAAARTAGVSQEELMGKHCYRVYMQRDTPCETCPALRTLATGKTDNSVISNKEGAMYKVRSIPVSSGLGEVEGVMVIARDVTEKHRLEAQLRQSQKMEAIGTLAGGIAHDFNNVLTIIAGNLELAEEDVPHQNPARICLSEALKACGRARDLVSQILSFSRRTETTPRLIRLYDSVQDSLHLLRHTIPSTIRVRLVESTARDTVMADPTQISQILLNLTSNAAHAMRESGGDLVIAVDNAEEDALRPPLREDTPWGWVRMVFSDSGAGIPAHLLKRVFDPYFTTKAVGEGTGMGLSVVHGIVNSYGGHIRVESEEGKGTIFYVYLPLVMGDPGVEERECNGRLPRGTERVLLVDDEAPVANMAREALERLGYQVTAHTQSLAALADFALSPQNFDLIVTDQTMPHLTGLALSQKIHDIRKDIPVLLLTGFSESVNEETTKVAGVAEVLLKPVSKATLAMAIRRVLEKEAVS